MVATPAPDQDVIDLRHHGDRDVADGLVDLAVNVRLPRPPDWLRDRLVRSLDGIAGYPDATAARLAVAARHGRRISAALVTAGAAEAFTLIARALRPGVDVHHAVVVHPQFTEPEVALDTAGHTVHRLLLDPAEGFRLDPALVPDEADLVVIGNPTNPTSVLHPAARLRQLARPGRILVVDEAFMDAIPGEPESLADTELPGLLVIRSLTKTWGLAGLRAGYVVGDESLIGRLAAVQSPWSVSSPAAVAVGACLEPHALRAAHELALSTERDRDVLTEGLTALGVHVVGQARGPFVLLRLDSRHDGRQVRHGLRQAGFAVRRGDTFPGLGPQWMRIAVRDPHITTAFLTALAPLLAVPPPHAAPASLGDLGHSDVSGSLATSFSPRSPSGSTVGAGTVSLVGAGPGDPGLVTVRGQQRLAEADVVVTDRLVPHSLLDELRPGVQVVDVAKIPRGPATAQERINEILVEHALAGRRVVRLKGGDPFVFGRGMEEVEACLAAGVPVEVVPGVSSAIAVPALAGIPATHRGLSQGFTVISAHVPPGDPQATVDWGGIARSGTTIVLMMAVHTLPDVVAELMRQGMDPATPAACVENGGTSRQRVLTGDLAGIVAIAADAGLRAPAVTVIGAVSTFARARTQAIAFAGDATLVESDG
jgi:histidinol-phosphate aminotransferase